VTLAAGNRVAVRIRAFARLRELLGDDFELALTAGSTLADVWARLRERSPEVGELAASTRTARNGRVARALNEPVGDGDEIALLPPVGGG
jgi:molybdopterin synthase sulfur carrier subunit